MFLYKVTSHNADFVLSMSLYFELLVVFYSLITQEDGAANDAGAGGCSLGQETLAWLLPTIDCPTEEQAAKSQLFLKGTAQWEETKDVF